MAELTPEAQALLKELRIYLANSNDPWELRRALLERINGLIGGGEMEMLIGSMREMAHMGVAYAEAMQTFQRLFAGEARAGFAELFTKGFGPGPFSGQAGFDFFKQVADFMNAQAAAFGKQGKGS